MVRVAILDTSCNPLHPSLHWMVGLIHRVGIKKAWTMKNPFKRIRKIKLRKLLDRYRFENIKLNAGFIKTDIRITNVSRNAAWELYVEMLTRVVTQPLPSEDGDDKTALESVYSLFPTTREILRRYGPEVVEFSKIAIPVLNQQVRPFTAKWHRLSLQGAFDDNERRQEFRGELKDVQEKLRNYNRMLAEIAGVEDITDLEGTGEETQ